MIKKSPCQEKRFCDRMMFVDVSILSKDSIKIKGKNSSFVIDPVAQIQKVTADAIVFLKDTEEMAAAERVTDYRIIIKGAGEYEVAGTRILGTKSDGNFLYSFNIDSMSVFVVRASGLSISQETGDYNILILNVDCDFKDTMVTGFSPGVVILFGEKAQEALKMLGKEGGKSQKFSISADKLPLEMQAVLLQ